MHVLVHPTSILYRQPAVSRIGCNASASFCLLYSTWILFYISYHCSPKSASSVVKAVAANVSRCCKAPTTAKERPPAWISTATANVGGRGDSSIDHCQSKVARRHRARKDTESFHRIRDSTRSQRRLTLQSAKLAADHRLSQRMRKLVRRRSAPVRFIVWPARFRVLSCGKQKLTSTFVHSRFGVDLERLTSRDCHSHKLSPDSRN